MTTFLRSGGPNYDVDAVSRSTGLECKDVSLTVQAQAKDADINVIMKRALVTGELPQRPGEGMFGDFTRIPTYREAQQVLAEWTGYFSKLPAEIRSQFGNDSTTFAEFCSDGANIPELARLGLVKLPEAAAAPVSPAARVKEAPVAPEPVAPRKAPKTN